MEVEAASHVVLSLASESWGSMYKARREWTASRGTGMWACQARMRNTVVMTTTRHCEVLGQEIKAMSLDSSAARTTMLHAAALSEGMSRQACSLETRWVGVARSRLMMLSSPSRSWCQLSLRPDLSGVLGFNGLVRNLSSQPPGALLGHCASGTAVSTMRRRPR